MSRSAPPPHARPGRRRSAAIAAAVVVLAGAAGSGAIAATRPPADRGAETIPAVEHFAWHEAAPYPIDRFEGNGLAAFGRLWVLGGFGKYTTQASPRSDAYDPATDTWTRIADLPFNATHSPAVPVGTDIWLIGGFIGNHPGLSTKEVWVYDTTTDTWSRGPDLPQPRGAGGAALVGGMLHYFGGVNRRTHSTDYGSEPDHWALDLADPAAGWQPRADVPKPRNHLSGATLGGAIYAIGGQIGGEDDGNQDEVDRYDPETDTWTRVADMPTARGHISASTFVLGGRIVVGGGTNNGNRPSTDMAAYDPRADDWGVLPPLPAGRKTPVMGAIGGRLVSSTGYGGVGTDTTWVSNGFPFDVTPEPAPPPPAPGSPQAPPPAQPQTGPSTEPAAPAAHGRHGARGRIRVTLRQLRIDQRIAQAALRRVRALEATVLGRPAPRPPRSGAKDRVTLTARQLRINQRVARVALRRVLVLEARIDGRPPPPKARHLRGVRVTLTARQLLINQRISQAVLRRVHDLAERVAGGAP
jgi:N-acetylneuraminic acid mutarotase